MIEASEKRCPARRQPKVRAPLFHFVRGRYPVTQLAGQHYQT
jgi:hypothetical protein